MRHTRQLSNAASAAEASNTAAKSDRPAGCGAKGAATIPDKPPQKNNRPISRFDLSQARRLAKVHGVRTPMSGLGPTFPR